MRSFGTLGPDRGSRIAYINDYGIGDDTLADCRSLKYPKNHLWGMQGMLLSGAPVLRVHNHPASTLAHPLLARIEYKVRRILSHASLAWAARDADIVYAPQSGHTTIFAILRVLGLSRKRLVAAVHHPTQRVVAPGTYHRILFISREVMERFRSLPGNEGVDNLEYVFWGPDLEFYDHVARLHPKAPADGLRFISNGKTGRDNALLLEAATRLGVQATVICDRSFVPAPAHRDNPAFSLITHASAGNVISDTENIRLLQQAQVMVLPVVPDRTGLCGLTSFLDAIALGMPIILSHNTMIGIDVEAEGFGLVYRAGDLDGLTAAMRRFQQEPGLIAAMGAKARAFAESHSSAHFQERVETLLAECRARP